MAEKVKRNYFKLERRFLQLWGGILGFVLSLSGMSGCSGSSSEIEQMMPMYGIMPAEYKIIGTITSSNGSSPVPSIRVTIDDPILSPSTYTDSEGKFEIIGTCGQQPVDLTINLSLDDVDGAANGEFINKDIPVTIAATDYDPDTRIAEKTQDVALDPKVLSE